MNFKELKEDLLEAKKVLQDIPGRFAKIKLKSGKIVLAFYDKDKIAYVIDASIKDMDKFKKWVGKHATIDMRKTGSKVRLATGKKVPTVNLRVEIIADKIEDNENKKKLENGKELVL